MTSLAVCYEEIRCRFKLLSRDVVGLVIVLLSALAIILAIKLSQARQGSGSGQLTKRNVSPSVLIAATNAGARDLTAVGERAKQINASLPFDKGPVEAAAPFVVGTGEANYPRALLCLRAAVYHEAGFEPLTGRRAVAQVILNRARHSAFPKSVCDVVYQGAASPVCQFSFACDQARHRPVAAAAWREAEQVAAEALAGHVESSVGTSTHYHADYVAPRWAPLLTKVSRIGAHIFYRWPGSWGKRRAFLRRYLGKEASTIGRAMEIEAATANAMQMNGVRGVALVEVRAGKITLEIVRGVHKQGASISAGDVWDVGAHEELVMATLIARLVEKGLVSWDTPLREFLPDLVPYMRPELQSVTLVELLSDRSILAVKNDPAFTADIAQGAHPLILQRASNVEKVLNSAKATGKSKSVRDPGLVIAAAAVEGVAGRPYEDLVREEIFEPLGLRSAGFAGSSGRSAKPIRERIAGAPPSLSQAGRMQMSLSDFGIFLVDQMQGEAGKGKLLSARSYQSLHQPRHQTQKPKVNSAVWHAAPFNARLHEGSGYYWLAGINMGATSPRTLIVAGVPTGKNRLVALSQAIEMARLSFR